MSESRIKWVGQKKIVLHDGNGKNASLVRKSLIECVCQACGGVFFVTSNYGTLSCAYCKYDRVKCTWGNLQVAFVPEKDAQFLRDTTVKVKGGCDGDGGGEESE